MLVACASGSRFLGFSAVPRAAAWAPLLAAFLLAHLIQLLGESLHYMEPVDRDFDLGKVLSHAVEKNL